MVGKVGAEKCEIRVGGSIEKCDVKEREEESGKEREGGEGK